MGDSVRIVIRTKVKKAFSLILTTVIQKIGMDFTCCLSLAAATIVEDAQQNVSWKQVR